MKRNLLLVLLAFTSIATFAQNQINDQVRKANLFIDGGMLFSIQKFVSQSSTENEVEFCGWIKNSVNYDLSTEAGKIVALNDAREVSRKISGSVVIPSTVSAAVTYRGQLQGYANYNVAMIRADLFRDYEGQDETLQRYNETQITAVTIPASVRLIESRCFDGCRKLTSVTIVGVNDGTSKLERIESHAFQGCGFSTIDLPNSVKYLGEPGLTSKEGGVFEDCQNLTSITIPSSLESLSFPGFTFKNCVNLATINWNGIKPTEIGKGAFYNCDKITWDKIETSNLKKIGDEAFAFCKVLTSVDLSKINYLGVAVFRDTPLTSVEWPAALTEVPAKTFLSCHNLASITGIASQSGAWDNVTKIGEDAFNECKALTTIKLPNSLKTLDKQAFRSCWNLKNVEYSNQLETIGEGAFQDNISGFEKFYFKGSVKNVGSYAFANGKLTCVHLKGDMTMGDYVFQDDKSLKYVEFPATSSATQPLTKVTEGMFQNCTSLPFITLPSTVTEIKTKAFDGCSSLKYVNILAASPATLGANAFPTTAGVYVKPSKLSAYQANAAWNAYSPKDTYEQTLATKYASFDHDFPVSFVAKNGHEALEAYVGPSTYRVTQPTKVQKILKMIKVTSTAANEGVLLKGEVGRTYTYQIAETDPGLYTGNRVIGVREDTTLVQTESDGKSNWVLQPDYKLHLVSNGTIKSGRAYVHETNDGDTSFGAKGIYLSFALNEEKNTTGIDKVENKKADEENVYYTLSGVRVINPTEKGVYIKNGKKVIIR